MREGGRMGRLIIYTRLQRTVTPTPGSAGCALRVFALCVLCVVFGGMACFPVGFLLLSSLVLYSFESTKGSKTEARKDKKTRAPRQAKV